MLPKQNSAMLICSIVLLLTAAMISPAYAHNALSVNLPPQVTSGAVRVDQMDKLQDGRLRAERNGVVVDLPSKSSESVRVASKHSRIDITLPSAKRASKSLTSPQGFATFDNLDGSATSSVLKDDGSLQIVTTISSSAAPTAYTYDLSLEPGSILKALEEGAVAIFGADGGFRGGFATPWAKDADGVEVATRYVIEGNRLVQIVEHRDEGIRYPVTADPWLGQNLYRSAWVTFVPRGYKVNAQPTAWGAAFSGPVTWGAHVDELRTKLGIDSWRMTDSVKEQLYCHLAGVPASLWEFNMESWRPIMNWATQAPWNCNYPEGGWGSWYN
ncbi:hypothetical protein [Arthrobacter sp. M4]|uniref:hypothetical protein n=1 Tax=Arthrobacter sp. M4 TaxID=218160 RepID=UPI001CDC8083|nr:hypothetical protein [Arthrobacter sp. M4]MCA4133026.1 hypothetical protein [Arthrobacter sp. M4]